MPHDTSFSHIYSNLMIGLENICLLGNGKPQSPETNNKCMVRLTCRIFLAVVMDVVVPYFRGRYHTNHVYVWLIWSSFSVIFASHCKRICNISRSESDTSSHIEGGTKSPKIWYRKGISFNGNHCFLIQLSLKFFVKDTLNNTKSHDCFRLGWLCAEQAANHYLSQRWSHSRTLIGVTQPW